MAHRNLLGDAVRAAAAEREHQARHRDEFAIGVAGGDRLERLPVVSAPATGTIRPRLQM